MNIFIRQIRQRDRQRTGYIHKKKKKHDNKITEMSEGIKWWWDFDSSKYCGCGTVAEKLSLYSIIILESFITLLYILLQFYESGTLVDLSESTMHDVTRYSGPPCFHYRNRCLNNSRCVPNLDDFACRCPPNFTGKICDICAFTRISFLSYCYSYWSKHIFEPANEKHGSLHAKWFFLI